MGVLDFIGIVNAVGLLTHTGAVTIVESCIGVRKQIGQKYPQATWDLGQALDEEDASALSFRTLAGNLNRLHNALSKVAVVEYNMRSVKGLSVWLMFVVAISMILGVILRETTLLFHDPSAIDQRVLYWAFYYVPGIAFLWQLILKWKIYKADDFIKSLRSDEIADLLDWDKE